MHQRGSFERLANEASTEVQNRLAEAPAGRERRERERLEYIDEILRRDRFENRIREPAVFLSYAKKSGKELRNEIYRAIRSVKAPGTDLSFKVLTGFSAEGEPLVVDHVVYNLEMCCIFVGVLTAEYGIKSGADEEGGFVPGAWVLLEAGLAIGLRLPVVFLVERGVRKDFWFDQLGGRRHVEFERGNMIQAMKVLKTVVAENYKYLRR